MHTAQLAGQVDNGGAITAATVTLLHLQGSACSWNLERPGIDLADNEPVMTTSETLWSARGGYCFVKREGS